MAWLRDGRVRAAALRAAPCLALLLLLGTVIVNCQGNACSRQECETCSNDYVTCRKCRSGHHLDGKGFCMPCKDPLADICTATRTLTCMTANYSEPSPLLLRLDPKSGACITCPGLSAYGPCETCGPDGKCSKCIDGNYLDSKGVCKECPPLCTKCNATGCIQCDWAFYGEDSWIEFPSYVVYKDAQGRCQKCTAHPYDTGCTKCDAQGRCIECSDPAASSGTTVLDTKAGRCVKCKDSLCGKCDPQQPSKCFFCAKEPYWSYWGEDFGLVYRDSKTGDCKSCQHTIENGCLACNGRGECTRCQKETSVLRGGRCVPCSAFIGRCAYCSSDGKKCLSCDTGYGLTGNRCVPCPPGCSDCQEPVQGSCVYCSDGFYYAGKGMCKKKPEGCAAVNRDGTCHTCEDLFRLAGGRCVKSDIIQCSSDGFCTKCGPDGETCVQCSQLWPGFTKDCKRCKDPLCAYCQDSPTNCTGCLEGWITLPDGSSRGTYMDGTGRCHLCPRGCSSCRLAKAGVVCEQCSMRYTRVGNECQRCKSPFCNWCDATPDKCSIGGCDWMSPAGLRVYRNSAGMCVVGRIKGCDEYSGDGSCKICEYGYLLRNGKCVV